MKDVRTYGEKMGKYVVFTELGYDRSVNAPYEPWKRRVGDDRAEELQALCLSAALEAVEREPRVVGAFLWKWFPGKRTPRDFAKSTPVMRKTIAAHLLRRE